jgi:hypothetical protein
MTDELGAEYRYLCTTCHEILDPREVRQHTGECAAVSTLSRLDMWLTDNVDSCPECEASVEEIRPPHHAHWIPWHEDGAESVLLKPCGHEVDTEEVINEHGE